MSEDFSTPAWAYLDWDVSASTEHVAKAARMARDWAARNEYALLEIYVEKDCSQTVFRQMLTDIDRHDREDDGGVPAIIFPVRYPIRERRLARLMGRKAGSSWTYRLRVQRLY